MMDGPDNWKPIGALAAALVDVLEQEHRWAVGMTRIAVSASPGADPKNWRTHVSPKMLRLMDEAAQRKLWEPPG